MELKGKTFFSKSVKSSQMGFLYIGLMMLVTTHLSSLKNGVAAINISHEFKSDAALSNQDSGGGCGAKFAPAAMDKNITQKCVELIGMRMDQFPPRREDLIKINYDDKCFSKCYLTEINYLTTTDSFDRSGIMDEIKKVAPPEKLSVVMDSINRCIHSTEEMAKVEGGISNSICKYSLVFFACQRDEERKIVC